MKDGGSAFPIFHEIKRAIELLDNYDDHYPKAVSARIILEDVLDLLKDELRNERQEKRDYFAGQALAGMSEMYMKEMQNVYRGTMEWGQQIKEIKERYARKSYLIAAAMLAEREKSNEL